MTARPDVRTTGFWKIAEQDRDRLAIADPSYREISCGELYDLTNRISRGLRALGLERGDHIATTLPNSIELPAVQEFCRTRLAGYKVPRQLHVTDEIPRTPVGKPDYRWAKSIAMQTIATEEKA